MLTTFAPVLTLEAICLTMTIILCYKTNLTQVDICSAFFHPNIDVDMYMYKSKGFIIDSTKVCKLLKDLYSLKQASHL
jgi:hypothetical protein